MEVKKSRKADLERKRNLFLQIGFVAALGVSLVAFEWKTTTDSVIAYVDNDMQIEDLELPPITTVKEPEQPKPVPPKVSVQELIIVDDDEPIDDVLEFTTESTEDLTLALNDMSLDDESDDEAIPFVVLEEKPEFPGGERALIRYLAQSVNYPVIAQENGIQGKVYLSFVIGKTGKVRDVKILRGVDSSLDKEAIRVVSSMPDWTPGKQRNKFVSVSYQVPINFKLQ